MYFLNRHTLLISGKGGVGRTAVSAAIGLASSKAKKRTLVLEIAYEEGSQSALGARFGRPDLNEEACPINDFLAIGRLNAKAGHSLFLRTILPSKTLIAAALRSKAVHKFLTAAPSLHEMGIFYHLLTLLQKTRSDGTRQYELIIIDMPATGHTLALTGLPAILLRLIPAGPIARALKEGQSILNNPELCEAWIVTLPEKLPVTEALELVDGLTETDVTVGGMILNRMPPDPFTDDERAALDAYCDAEHFFGQLTLARIRAAKVALSELKNRFDSPVLDLPEVVDTDLVTNPLTAYIGELMGTES
ncbi:MAG: ArsA family ATPase [Myxococcota bacterium]|nr:ArsA family ATPase [Myxococcota bacterium]